MSIKMKRFRATMLGMNVDFTAYNEFAARQAIRGLWEGLISLLESFVAEEMWESDAEVELDFGQIQIEEVTK